jgi:hypothetical protein
MRAVPRLCELFPGIFVTTEEKHGNTSFSVVGMCPDIPVAVVQHTFTHNQYKAQHNDNKEQNNNNKEKHNEN